MAMKIRLARAGSKKRPFYRIVAADSRMPRDGRFLEKLGTYNPLLPKDSEDRVKMDLERIQHWLDKGAQPTDRIARFLEAAGVTEKKERANPQKGTPGKKAQERAEAAFIERESWLRMSIINCARSGRFSTDRTMQEYNRDIWKLEPIEIEPIEDLTQ